MHKPAPVQFPIHPLLRERWSPRAFASDRPVPQETLLSLLEAARWSPSSGNRQPWRFIIAQRSNEVAFHTMLNVLNESNRRWAKDAALLVLIAARVATEDGTLLRHGGHDAGIALASLTLEALERGLFVHTMGGFNAEKARDTYAIPQHFEPMTVSAVGYYGQLAQLPEDLQKRELAPRERQPLAELVFEGRFGHTASLVK
jgi:nitroreductase